MEMDESIYDLKLHIDKSLARIDALLEQEESLQTNREQSTEFLEYARSERYKPCEGYFYGGVE